MRELSAGDDAVLLDFSAADDPARAATRAARVLREAAAQGRLRLADVVPSGLSVLVQAGPGEGIDSLAVYRELRARAHGGAAPGEEPPAVTIPVVYDGEDLAEVAGVTGTDPGAVARAHAAIGWRVQFMGFAPGFGYLVPDDEAGNDPTQVALFAGLARRDRSRPAVPAGSVAVAAGYSAVYPRVSPGGWFLLGRTDFPMWDVQATPPATLAAGTRVRFTCLD